MDYIRLSFQVSNTSRGTRGLLTVMQGEKALAVDTLDIAKEKNRNDFLTGLIDEYPGLHRQKDELRKQLLQLAAEQSQRNQNCAEKPEGEDQNEPLEKSKIALAETAETEPALIELAEKLLRSPDLLQMTINHVDLLGVAGEKNLIIAIYVIGTSRLLAKPLAGLVMGVSSAGKSFVIDMVSRLFPDEAVLRAHRISPRALQYLPPGSLIHRFVVAGERSRIRDEAAAEATRALREMISDGRLSTLVSVTQRSGPCQTVHMEQEGPIAYIESTTLGVQDIFNEDRTRFILLCSDEGIEQSRAVVDKIAQSASQPTDADTPDSIIALHHTAQRLLRPLEVAVPFAEELKGCLSVERVEVRRTFGHMISLIQAVALLHQFQRPKNDKGHIIATPADYEIVRRYLAEPLATSLGCALTPGAKDLLEKVKPLGEYAVTELEGQVPYSINTIRSRNRELVAAGYVVETEPAKGRSPARYMVVGSPPASQGLILPELWRPEEHDFLRKDLQFAVDKT
ncbi:MAG: hypothetical protein ACYTEQ_11575 [Planctomycetota bacterium]|jgi:hypothetical protein